MRRTGVCAVVAVLSLAACEFPHPDPGAPDASVDGYPGGCAGDPPGCTAESCGFTCGGTLYSCHDGHWVEDGGCDWCISGVSSNQAHWTWGQGFDLGSCSSAIEPRSSVTVDTTPSGMPFEPPIMVADDADLVITPVLYDYGAGYGYCTDHWSADLADVWTVDGVATPVSGGYDLTAKGPGRTVVDTTIEGTAYVQVGTCILSGTVTGTWEYTAL